MSCAIDIEGDFDLLLGRRKDLIQSVFVGLCLDPRRIRETASRAPATPARALREAVVASNAIANFCGCRPECKSLLSLMVA